MSGCICGCRWLGQPATSCGQMHMIWIEEGVDGHGRDKVITCQMRRTCTLSCTIQCIMKQQDTKIRDNALTERGLAPCRECCAVDVF